ncbi:DNA polymerase III subunit theta [Serratia proteamaculans]|jgi:DNA polymerase-3 subunit theta|uniref:DNA polymerase III subunit theta n=1 Tax=Serratia proteamaculans TaxID=28151 RepID=UPI000D96633A|nr:DNA polymerase III subunit theta [Serratia proteamaculans]SPZ54513.1 DNA polymerase III subunit theta [Serratia quinivorans]NWA72678.1 DNA polymerase II [Serratia proteamaculans]CAI0720645.1 DNA polymerase III subunit theta [Serratia proteamaculans]CAI0721905.1 DNA polymerase III subunit theta [Serratia proteamaculans]CAI0841384.1 DNA polymerase III subunit theta [Serratia proteamaculans]
MGRKLDSLPQAEREKIEVDLLALSVIYNERYGITVNDAANAEQQVPDYLRPYFHLRLNYYRSA